MAEVVGVGIVAIDVIDEVAEFPKGGNVANALVVAAQLGCSCHWVGTTTDPERDSEAAFARAELEKFRVDCSTSTVLTRGSMPVSYILASKATGSRTIVHSRDLAELTADDFALATATLFRRGNVGDTTKDSDDNAAAATSPMWFHFEGRNMEPVLEMMRCIRARSRSARISVEIEALRYDWKLAKRLAMAADYVFVSKDYIRDNLGFQDAASFLQAEFSPNQTGAGVPLTAVICPWGADGVYFLDLRDSESVQQIATRRLECVVESIGAGDTFIGACVAALANNVSLGVALQLACEVATEKCSSIGFELPSNRRGKWIDTIQISKKATDTDV